MIVRVTPMGTTGDLLAVSLRPGWLARLVLRADERDFFAVRVRSYRGGHVWIDDKSGAPITSPRILAAIERHYRDRVQLPNRSRR